MLVRSVVLVVVAVSYLEAWPHGAPASACDTLMPVHNNLPAQDSISPYKITLDHTSYRPGQNLQIHLEGPEDKPFLGFLLEVRTAAGGGCLGTLEPVRWTQHVRGCGDCTLTHTDSTKQKFHNLTVIWRASLDSTQPVIVRATFVQFFNTFWSDVSSDIIELLPEDNNNVKPVSSIDDSPVEGAQSENKTLHAVSKPYLNQESKDWSLRSKFDTVCGKRRGCFVSCDSYNCDYVVSWESKGELINFEITAKTTEAGDQWVAIGFSDDISMGNDSVVDCVSNGGVVKVSQSFNFGYDNKPLQNASVGLYETGGSIRDGVFRCEFTKKKRIVEDDLLRPFDLHMPWIIMFANGEARNGEKMMHSLSPRYGPWTSGVAVPFDRVATFGKGSGSTLLIRLHGCFMVVAWVLAAALGIFAARYYRQEWSSFKPMGQAVWFLIHRGCLLITFTLVLVGLFIIYEEANRGFGPITNGYVSGKLFESVHPSLGLATICLTFLNPILAVLRPDKDAKYRPVFNWAHRSVGIFTFVLAVFSIAFGLGMEKVGVGNIGLYVMAGYGIYIGTIALVLETYDCVSLHFKQGKSEKLALCKGECEPLTDNHTFSSNEVSLIWNWKIIFFVGNSAVLLIFTAFLIILIAGGLESFVSN